MKRCSKACLGCFLLGVWLFVEGPCAAQEQSDGKMAPTERIGQVGNAVINVDELEGFGEQPAAVRDLIRKAMELAGMNLKYKYGSADPSQGGMDCSGTIYFLLRKQGVADVPRSSDAQYHWLEGKGGLHRVSATDLESGQFAGLKPGDLLFWTGTYATSGISHVSIYLGRLKKDGKRVMIGASEGRRFEGVARNGVSVFDFVLPKPGSSSKFVGYGPVPGLLPKTEAKAASAQP